MAASSRMMRKPLSTSCGMRGIGKAEISDSWRNTPIGEQLYHGEKVTL